MAIASWSSKQERFRNNSKEVGRFLFALTIAFLGKGFVRLEMV